MKPGLLFFILLIQLVSSCKKDITLAVPEESNKVVLNMLMNKDSIIIARVTLSGRLSSTQPLPEIKNAIVNLYENGTFKELLTPYIIYGRTYYRGNTPAQAGATYRVTATVPGYEEVSGSDQIPDTVKVGDIRLTAVPIDNYLSTTISVQLHDDAAVQNYYRIRLYALYKQVNGGGWYKERVYFDVDDTEWELFSDKTRQEFYITDALFNGRSPRFTFRTGKSGEYKKMAVEITSLTYSSYNYLNSTFMTQQEDKYELSEKVIVYNNIENGLGIIGGVAQREYEIER